MIWKVLKNNIRPSQITGVFIGIMLGLAILMGALSFYIDIKPIFDDKEGFWKDEYIIINKRISIANTLSQVKSDTAKKPLFSEKEIDELKKLTYVKDVAKFSNCSFMISAYTDDDSFIPGFYTDLFFESVPDEFIDVNYDDWKWDVESNFVPIIIPKAYLNLYNFGFAQSQNLPQISNETVSLVKFNLIIKGQSKVKKFETRIIGFSERINTILVPKSFVDWGNKEFGQKTDPEPGRLIVVANDPSNANLFKYFDDKNYEVNKSELNNSKALAFLKIITTIIFIIGLIIIVLAFSLMIISIQLLLQKNNDNIKKLNLLGYSLKEISKPYIIFVIILFYVTFLCSLIPLTLLRNFYSSSLILLGYGNINQIFINVILPGLIFINIILFLLIIMITKQIKKIIL